MKLYGCDFEYFGIILANCVAHEWKLKWFYHEKWSLIMRSIWYCANFKKLKTKMAFNNQYQKNVILWSYVSFEICQFFFYFLTMRYREIQFRVWVGSCTTMSINIGTHTYGLQISDWFTSVEQVQQNDTTRIVFDLPVFGINTLDAATWHIPRFILNL